MSATEKTVSQSEGATPGLRRDAIGLREVLFQSITDMAPGAAIAASIPAGAALAGGSLPLSAVTLALGLKYDPTVAFAMVGTGLVILIVAIYILMNAACIGFFARRGTGFNWLSHLIIPLLGIAAFVPAWLTAAGIKVFSFVTPLAPPLSYMGPGVAGFMVLGLIYMIYLYRAHPGRVSDVGLVHLDALEEDALEEGAA
jgi:hypothetical protein